MTVADLHTSTAALARDDLAAWLRLLETPGIGRQRARRLLRAFGGPREVFEASPAAWREVLDGHKVSEALARPPEGHDALVERTAQWLEQQQARLLSGDHYHVIFTIPRELNGLSTNVPAVRSSTMFATKPLFSRIGPAPASRKLSIMRPL